MLRDITVAQVPTSCTQPTRRAYDCCHPTSSSSDTDPSSHLRVRVRGPRANHTLLPLNTPMLPHDAAACQALAEYARLLRTLHAALARTAAAASARWALSRWRAALEEPQQRAAAFARAACLWRHYAAWRWRVSLKTQRRELQVVVGQWWHIRAARKALRRWWGYAACKVSMGWWVPSRL